jgi:hypothetical protein
MRTRNRISIVAVVLAAALALTTGSDAQRARLGKVQSLQATVDQGGVHPSSAEVTGPVKITCMNSVSELPNSQPAPGCRIVAPGFTGNLAKGQVTNATGAGTVTLTCSGQGLLRCSARIDTPPAS